MLTKDDLEQLVNVLEARVKVIDVNLRAHITGEINLAKKELRKEMWEMHKEVNLMELSIIA